MNDIIEIMALSINHMCLGGCSQTSVIVNTVKLGIKAAAYVHFFTFLVRLLFEGGLQWFESEKPMKAARHGVTCTVKVKLDLLNVTKLFQNVNRHYCMQKAAVFSPTWTILCAAIFKPRLLLECSFCATWVWRKCGFWPSAAFIHNFTVRAHVSVSQY